MDSNEILRSDLLDIVFDNRNKDYGAYSLRRLYPRRIRLALLIALALATGVVFFAVPASKKAALLAKADSVVLTLVVIPDEVLSELPKPEIPPRTESAPPPVVEQKNFVSHIEIVDEVDPDKETPDMSDLAHAAISNQNVSGEATDGRVLPPSNIVGSGTEPAPKETPPAEVLPSSDPEFPGGAKAWLAFLNKNLVVPGELETGEHKTVVIRFEVNPNGSITGFTVLQSPGNIYDSEVMRVLKKMPKWKPALQNGVPVSRWFTQPVTFVGVEY